MARRRFQQGSVRLIGKRDKVWVGRYREDIVDSQGTVSRVKRAVTLGRLSELPTRRLALRRLAEELKRAGINQPTYAPRCASTFGDFAERWSATLTGYKPSTVTGMRSHLRTHLLPYFHDAQMSTIDTETLQRFVSHLAEHGTGANSARNVLMTLRIMWRAAEAWGYVRDTHDPFRRLRLPRQTRSARPYFTIEEIRLILARSSGQDRLLYRILTETGMRAGEIFGLRWEDFCSTDGTLRVSRSLWNGEVVETKSRAGERTFYLSSALTRELAQLATSGPMFLGHRGRPVRYNHFLRRIFYPFLAELGLPRKGLHAFRHANATFLDQAGLPMKARQERLGHANADLTMNIYTHAISGDNKVFAEWIGELLDGVPPATRVN